MALPTVFISYNPNSEIEQTLAIRLHTIGAVHGFNMLLPDRGAFNLAVSGETITRIQASDYFILFSTTVLSKTVLEEINVASAKLHDKSKILVIYDLGVGKNLKGVDFYTEVYINRTWSVEQILQTILDRIKALQKKGQSNNGFLSALGPILLTGIALFALSNILDDGEEEKRPRRKPAKKIAAKKTNRSRK